MVIRLAITHGVTAHEEDPTDTDARPPSAVNSQLQPPPPPLPMMSPRGRRMIVMTLFSSIGQEAIVAATKMKLDRLRLRHQ
jgi:hypothetical protein